MIGNREVIEQANQVLNGEIDLQANLQNFHIDDAMKVLRPFIYSQYNGINFAFGQCPTGNIAQFIEMLLRVCKNGWTQSTANLCKHSKVPSIKDFATDVLQACFAGALFPERQFETDDFVLLALLTRLFLIKALHEFLKNNSRFLTQDVRDQLLDCTAQLRREFYVNPDIKYKFFYKTPSLHVYEAALSIKSYDTPRQSSVGIKVAFMLELLVSLGTACFLDMKRTDVLILLTALFLSATLLVKKHSDGQGPFNLFEEKKNNHLLRLYKNEEIVERFSLLSHEEIVELEKFDAPKCLRRNC